ncbi:undecaprenyl-diphosphatase [Candidatus Planktophila dulcis]|uniref:Undecaprenyl-diphosphatase n=1 Tax=Candidatus Planktophila dulcis TaxID=1884914 RepID=A0AAC9YTD6_9ACTN|nr:undecaprenyl-diphosphate phosphatase [Candidatus Planktophila dulcis]ASY11865.1 undecaprenyl-diphosphatase [Candidatus Planktophila dulcis]
MLEALFLGIVQGLTEFLPISSSAHIRIVGEFLPNAKDPGAAFTAITQIGTELAVLLYFRRDILNIARAWFKRDGSPEARLGNLIIIGTLPIVALGYVGQDYITNNFRSLWVIACTLIIFGLILGFADRVGRSEKDLSTLNARDGIFYGLAQSMALIPGVSRSGATIALGRFLGYKREAALRYSFLLALPAVFGSGLYQLQKAMGDSTVSVYSMPEILIATITAFIIGYAVIAWLMKYISTKSFTPFVIYRVALGSALLIALATGLISAQ